MHVTCFSGNLRSVFVLEVSVGMYIWYICYHVFQYLFNSVFFFSPMCTRWKQLPGPNSSWPRIQCLWKMPGWYPGNWNPVWMWYSNNVNFPHLPLLMYFGLDLAGIKLFSKIISFLFLPQWVRLFKACFIGSNILSLFRKLHSQVTFFSGVSFHCSNLNPSLKTSASDGLLIV